MIYDRLATFADGTDVGALTAATRLVIGDQVDSSIIAEIGDGQTVYFYYQFGTGWTGGTAAYTIAIEVLTGSVVALTSNVEVIGSTTLSIAANGEPSSSDVGVIAINVANTPQRYLGFGLTSSAAFAAASAGAISSWLMLNPHTTKRAYPEGKNWV